MNVPLLQRRPTRPGQLPAICRGLPALRGRRIQYLQRTLRLAPSVTRDRCRAALADAVANGLPELEVRRMAKLPEWQVAELVAVPETTKPKRGR